MIRDITPTELQALKEKHPCKIVDVRKPAELASGYIEGSICLERDTLEINILKHVEQDTMCVVVCKSGTRARFAAQNLESIGYENLLVLTGGLDRWQNEGWNLLNSKVLIVGAGGLGCPAALYLAAMGIGTICIIDDDLIDLSNIHRQVLFRLSDAGRPKVTVATEQLAGFSTDQTLVPIRGNIDKDNATQLVTDADIVLECSDDLATKILLNETCVNNHTPLVIGAVYRTDGQIFSLNHNGLNIKSCYRCCFPGDLPGELAPTCSEVGVLGSSPGIIGMMQAHLAVQILTQQPEVNENYMVNIDLLEMNTGRNLLTSRPDCFCQSP